MFEHSIRGDLSTVVSVPDWAISALGEEYRAEGLASVPLEVWRDIIQCAYLDAWQGDYRAREWISRMLGLADAARVEHTLEIMVGKISHLALLGEVEEARSRAFRGIESPEVAPLAEVGKTVSTLPATYWSVVLEVITPPRWGTILATARDQALSGDPTARAWLSNVLGARDALGHVARLSGDDRTSSSDMV